MASPQGRRTNSTRGIPDTPHSCCVELGQNGLVDGGVEGEGEKAMPHIAMQSSVGGGEIGLLSEYGYGVVGYTRTGWWVGMWIVRDLDGVS